VSKSITPTVRPSRKTQLYGAKSPWQTTSAGSSGANCQPSSGSAATGTVASCRARSSRGGAQQRLLTAHAGGERIVADLAGDVVEDLAPLLVDAVEPRHARDAARREVGEELVDRRAPGAYGPPDGLTHPDDPRGAATRQLLLLLLLLLLGPSRRSAHVALPSLLFSFVRSVQQHHAVAGRD
jgi:hypothetical protein